MKGKIPTHSITHTMFRNLYATLPKQNLSGHVSEAARQYA